MKVYNWDKWTCCSGTYIQNMADYHNLIYFNDAGGLYVNLYVPSEVTWQKPDGDVASCRRRISGNRNQLAHAQIRQPVPSLHSGSASVMDAGDDRQCEWRGGGRPMRAGHLGDDRTDLDVRRPRRGQVPLTLRMEPVDRDIRIAWLSARTGLSCSKARIMPASAFPGVTRIS